MLDGRPRIPDAEGVLSSVNERTMRLGGGPERKIAAAVQSFSTVSLQTVPLLPRQGQYVQIGLQGSTVVWVASIGAVLPLVPPTVAYTGTVVRVEDGGGGRRAVFRDGTVLRLAKGAPEAAPGSVVRADLDPATGRVRALLSG